MDLWRIVRRGWRRDRFDREIVDERGEFSAGRRRIGGLGASFQFVHGQPPVGRRFAEQANYALTLRV
ncbi:hypothetical protein OJ998_10105 [Solirubrobacter taibaiensis]|nr:hypothetical protein [Solirubrobacter taibaiensis]